MPAIAQKASKKSGKAASGGSGERRSGTDSWKMAAICLVAGAVLGLAAPGINQWYLAWFGVAPLLILIATSNGFMQALKRGFLFGLGYNLVWSIFLLNLQPLDWLGFNWWQGGLLAFAAWVILSSHQGLITGLFAGTCRVLPLTGGFLPKKEKKGFSLPALLVIPLWWVAMHNFIGNAHNALGIPWTMLEYTQYRQTNFIQMASVIGGIGISFLLVMWNTAVAALAVALLKQKGAQALAVPSREHAFYQLLFSGLIIAAWMAVGLWQAPQYRIAPTVHASVLQGAINIDMQKTTHRYTLPELWSHYYDLTQRVSPGLCIWTENALPTYLRQENELEDRLSVLARQRKLDMVVGALDRDTLYHPYNSAYGITRDGTLLTHVYHKRYLVPFGEYCPWLVQYFPEWIKRLTNTPAGGGFTSGKEPTVLNLTEGRVAPLVCFETLSPELAASSVRSGGQILVNLSDLAWFHRSIAGDQMIAFSVLRAVENRRYFIFAANTGPSATIDNDGNIRQTSNLDKACILQGEVGLSSKLTPFTQWFRY